MDKNKKKDEEIDFSVYLEEYADKDQKSETDTEIEKSEEISVDETPKDKAVESSVEKRSVPEKIRYWWKTRNKKQKVIIIIVAVILAVLIAVGAFLFSKLSLIDTNDDFTGTEDVLEDDINISEMDSITDAKSLNDLLIKWATNGGEKMHSKNVKNVLLVGVRDGLADSIILASLNEKTKQINLVSFYRDSYTYAQPAGKKARFLKMNESYSAGGAKCLIKTIEDDYKIEIDDYALVDIKTFVKIVDALGGVDVNVTSKEANYLNATWREWTFTGNQVSYTTGINHLNGEKALMFCRIRHLDSDVGRTERQRRVITSIINQFKNASLSEMNSAANALLPNIKTSMSKTEILSYAGDAVSNGWLKYPLSQTTMPTTETARGGYIGDKWYWIVDYEGAAYQLQMLLYGKSNIKLSDNRVSAIDIKPTTTTVVGTQNSAGTTSIKKVTTTRKSVTTTKAYQDEITTEEEVTSATETTTNDEDEGTTNNTDPSNQTPHSVQTGQGLRELFENAAERLEQYN